MSKTKKDGVVDPILPFTEIGIGGKTYKMCFDYQALADAEEALDRKGIDAKLLIAMPRLRFWSVRLIFAASVYKFQPELAYADALKLVTPDTLWPIAEAITDAWNASMPEVHGEGAGEGAADPL